MRRGLLLGVAIAVAGLGAACSRYDPATPCPSPDGSIRVSGGEALPVCAAVIDVAAVGGGANLMIQGTLPDARPFGDDQGSVLLMIRGYTGPGTYVVDPASQPAGGETPLPAGGHAGPVPDPDRRLTVNTSDASVGVGGTRPSGPQWTGTCTFDIGPPGGRTDGTCDLRSDGRDPLQATIDLPAPATAPAWVEAEYEIGGSYEASGRMRLAVPASDAELLIVPMPDGSSLRIVPRGERPVFLDTVLPGSPSIVDHRPTAENGMQPFDPSFGSCEISLDASWQGSIRCPGAPGHPSGSVTLELETRFP